MSFKNYGNPGIKFKFGSFEEFFAEIGLKPSPTHSVDRINNSGHYEPGNIKWSTRSEQRANRSARSATKRVGTSSRFVGGCWDKQGQHWRAVIRSGGKQFYLGSFDSEIAAARAYDIAALKYFSDRAVLNFPRKAALIRASKIKIQEVA